MVTFNGWITAWIGDFLACMGGCFGCCTRPTPIIAVDKPSKGLRIQGRLVRKASISDDFWSTSTCDLLDNSIQSQRSISSISISNQTLNHCSSSSGMSSQSDFVNHGLLDWTQCRLQWTGNNRPKSPTQLRQEKKLSWNGGYESLFGSRSPFAGKIPLSEMVEYLVDTWEQEGLYD